MECAVRCSLLKSLTIFDDSYDANNVMPHSRSK